MPAELVGVRRSRASRSPFSPFPNLGKLQQETSQSSRLAVGPGDAAVPPAPCFRRGTRSPAAALPCLRPGCLAPAICPKAFPLLWGSASEFRGRSHRPTTPTRGRRSRLGCSGRGLPPSLQSRVPTTASPGLRFPGPVSCSVSVGHPVLTCGAGHVSIPGCDRRAWVL